LKKNADGVITAYGSNEQPNHFRRKARHNAGPFLFDGNCRAWCVRRSSNAVIAPDLVRDLTHDATDLGLPAARSF